MNVYDFDKTIFHYDCTAKFYFFELKRNFRLIRYFPKQLMGYIQYFLKRIDITEMKKYFYCYLKGIDDIDKELEVFWDKYIIDVNSFYLENAKEDDVVVTASAYFMVEGACKRLGIKHLIASKVDKYTGEVLDLNCSCKRKPIEFEKAGFSLKDINEFYSDSHKDDPMASYAKKPYFVVNGIPRTWRNK